MARPNGAKPVAVKPEAAPRLRSGQRALPSSRASLVFFLMAALFASAAVPLWTLTYTGNLALALSGPSWHAHEMVFGYALAVVARFLLTRLRPGEVAVLLMLWLAGRAAWFVPAIPPLGLAAIALAFPLLLFVRAGLPFLRAAKSVRNAIFALPLAGFLLAAIIYQLGALGVVAQGEARGLLLAIDLLALLLFVMGGRVIAAATSGALQRKGTHPRGFAQHHVELAGVLALLAMALLDALQALHPAAGVLALASGGIIAVRLWHWQIWRTLDVPEVLALHLGYGWLGLGLFLKGAAQMLGQLALPDALHGITIGALGTLSLAMMIRAAQQRTRRAARLPWPGGVAVALVSIAAIARLAAAIPDARMELMEASAAAWTVAFLLLLAILAAACPVAAQA